MTDCVSVQSNTLFTVIARWQDRYCLNGVCHCVEGDDVGGSDCLNGTWVRLCRSVASVVASGQSQYNCPSGTLIEMLRRVSYVASRL